MATISSGTTSSGQTISSGSTVSVKAGGTIENYTILNGGNAVVSGTDSGTTIQAGGTEIISSGTASGDQVFGAQFMSGTAGTVSNEVIFNGGFLSLTSKGETANAITIMNGGIVAINGSSTVNDSVIEGGSLILESPKANVTGSLVFSGAGTLDESSVISSVVAGTGVLATISGFGAGDVIELDAIGSGATMTSASSAGFATLSIAGGSTESGFTETFTFAGTGQNFEMNSITGGGYIITAASPLITIASGVTSVNEVISAGTTLDVLAGGSVTGAQILSGGSAVIVGTDTGATVALGGTEMVFGTASGDIVLGDEMVSGTASNLTLNGGVLTLASTNASITGGLSFGGASTLVETAIVASGVAAPITGFGLGDVIDLSILGTGATLTSATSGANAVLSVSGGSAEGGVVESFTLAGAAGDKFWLSSGGTLASVNPVITVSAGQHSTGDVVSAGFELNVLAGGTETSGSILSGGVAFISGTDSGSSIALGGTETVLAGGRASGEAIASGGSLAVASGGTASNIVLSGGVLELSSANSTLSGGITFAGEATLKEDGLVSPTALITGFGTNDVIDLATIGTGAIITSTTIGGNTVLTISGGSGENGADLTMTMTGTGAIYTLGKDAEGTGETLTSIPILTSFTSGDIVIGVVGDVNDSGDYGDNQGAPVALEEIDPTTGKIIGEMVLPQTTSVVNGVVENIFSGEYGSSSEGILELSGDGESLVIAGYGINAAAYNAAEVSGGINTYGTAALAQTTSVETSGGPTPVTRVIADIGYNGTIDTSTALLNVFDGNNPRSVSTVDGKVFYIAGQGQSGDTTQGVFVAEDGASAATAVDTSTDARDVEIYNGNVYVSINSKQDGDVATVDEFNGQPTGASTPTALPGIGNSVLLTAATENSVNGSAVGTAVNLSPEQYFFANATTLYIADGGDPKGGGLGDGGLQKWVLNTGTGQWTLAYTLSAGLNQVADTGSAGTTGLIGLTGVLHADGTVTFYATNSTLGDLDQTYLYTITDTVSATTPASGAAFSIVTTAAPDTNVRGIAQAPSAPTNTLVSAGQTSAGLTISTGSTLTVQTGGSISGVIVNAGGTAFVSGSDSASLIAVGGTETVYGSATGDNVDGTQIVSGAVSNETVYYGGTMQVMSGGTANGITTEVNGGLVISGSVSNLLMSGGVAALATPGASLSGVTFAGSGEIAELIAGTSVVGVISGFASGDVIDLTQVGTAAVLTSAVVGGNTVETVTSGGFTQSFTLAGTYASGAIVLTKDGNGGVEMTIVSSGGSTSSGTTSSGSNSVTVSSGQTSANLTVNNGGTLAVLAGGTVTSPLVLSGGIAKIAGTDTGAVVSTGGTLQLSAGAVEDDVTILTGGTELEVGSATVNGGQIYGLQEVVSSGNSTSGATLSNETIYNGGEVEFLLKGYTLQNSTILSGGEFYINGNATGRNLTLAGGTIQLDSPKANLMGTLDFESGTLDVSSVISSVSAGSAFGDLATITHFGAGDVIEFTAASITGLKETSSTAGTITTVTLSVTSGGSTQVSDFTFANVGDLSVVTLANGVIELLADTPLSGGTEIVSSGGVVSNTTVTNGGTLVVSGGTESGGVISSGGTEIISSGGTATGTTVINGGTQVVTNGATVTGAFIEQDSTQIISSGGVAIDTTIGDPSVQTIAFGGSAFDTTLTAGGELDIFGSVTATTVDAGGVEIVFSGGTAAGNLINSGGTLVLDGGTATDTTLIAGGTIINDTLAFVSGMTGTISDGELVVNGGSVAFTLQLDGDYSTDTVHVSAASDGSVEVTLCFYPGTNIATPQGNTVVEALRPSDLVLTANGPLPVRWVGQSHIATQFADKQRSLPIRITQGALGNGLPVRDLLLSPDHAVFIGGILVQASALVNDATIFREYDVPAQFTYYHVELATHELLVAEGVQAESFVDNVDRMHFHNWDDRTAPALPITEMPYPRAKSQRQLPQTVRRMFAASKRA
jgi:autotransporter passenger strand-loop-strand repeat protein